MRTLSWRSLVFSWCLWLALSVGGLLSVTPRSVWAQAEGPSDENSSLLQKAMLAFLGTGGAGLRGLSSTEREAVTRVLRDVIEHQRFVSLDIQRKRLRLPALAQRLARVAAKRSSDLAKMKADWSSEFQGYAVTTEMLQSLRNKIFAYTIRLNSFERTGKRFQPSTSGGGAAGLLMNLATSALQPKGMSHPMGGTLTFYQIIVFECVERNKSDRHKYACRGKSDEDVAGFAKQSKQVSASVISAPVYGEDIFTASAELLGRALLKEINKYEEFRQYIPLERASQGIKINYGKADGAFLGQGFDLYVMKTNGKLEPRGYIRLRDIGDNRMEFRGQEKVRLNPKAPYYSEAEAIIASGRLMKGLLAVERPMLGWQFGFHAGIAAYNSLALQQQQKYPPGTVPFPISYGAGLAPALQLTVEKDLSPQIGWNEIYAHINLETAFVGQDAGLGVGLLLNFGLMKKFYLRQFVWTVGFRLGVGYLFGTNESSFLFGADLMTGPEIFFSPQFSLALRFGFRFYASTEWIDSLGNPAALGAYSLGPWITLGGTFGI